MQPFQRETPTEVEKYVLNGTIIVNIILLTCHLCFGVLFYLYQANVLFAYNCLSILTYLSCFAILKKKKAWTYVIIVYVEIFIFMVLAVTFLGWEYGFQHYCIGFVASMIFTDFYMSEKKIISNRTIWLGSINVALYLALRFWTYHQPYVYEIGNQVTVRLFYICNTIFGFAFLILYSNIYSNTVIKLENELLQIANIDPLTGLCNRRKMSQILKSIVNTNGHTHLAIAMLDVDYFKKTNDTYGHDAGDEVLKMLANILNQKNAKTDTFQVCRWGGEEFLVLYGNYNGTPQDVVAEFDQIRQDVANNTVIYDGKAINVTVTIGLVFYEKDLSIDDLIRKADAKLYEGKQTGRNKVVY